MRLSDLKPAPYNPRKRLKPGDKAFEALKASIERWDLVEPLVVNIRTGNIISGHQRYNALLELGYEQAECSIVDLDDHKEKLLNVAMNRITGLWNYDKLEVLFAEFGMEDIQFTGFTEGEIHTLFDKELEAAAEFEDSETEGDGGGRVLDEKFTLYLSFASRDEAEGWLKMNGYEERFTRSRILVVVPKGGA